MMHHRDAPDVEGLGDGPDAQARRGPEQVQDAPPRGVPQRVEDLGHVVEGRGRAGGALAHMSKNIDILSAARKSPSLAPSQAPLLPATHQRKIPHRLEAEGDSLQ